MLLMMNHLFVIFLALTPLIKAERDWTNVYALNIEPFGLLRNTTRIVGGEEAVANSFPYQAALFLQVGQKTGFCGGSIISEDYILSAAHCLYQASSVEVILGAHKIHEDESTQQRFVSSDIIVHPGWNPIFLTSDIGLVKAPEKIKFTNAIQPIRLPRYSDITTPLTKKPATISGWGKDSDRATAISPVLRYVKSDIISNFICRIYYFGIPGNNHVCLNGIGGKSACNGDSGGPLTTVEEDGQLTQQGLVSFGLALGCEIGWPSVFTRVGSFVPWINKNTGIPIRD